MSQNVVKQRTNKKIIKRETTNYNTNNVGKIEINQQCKIDVCEVRRCLQ